MSGVPASDVDIVRRAYAALAANDMLELEQCFARDAVWHEPGGNVFSGDRVGWQGIRDEFLHSWGRCRTARSVRSSWTSPSARSMS